MKSARPCLLPILAILTTLAASSHGATVSANFNAGTFASNGLTDLSNITTPTIGATIGTGASGGLDFGSDGASGGGSQSMFSSAYFSMMGRYNGAAGTSAGTMGFGWTRASGEFNPFSGTGTGVAVTDHVVVSVARSAGNTFTLAAANGVMGAMGAGTLFGTTTASLISGNWYRLEGTVLFDSGTGTFTFNTVSLDDFGSAGTAEVTANILAGTGKTVTTTGFGTTGQPVFINNRDRGFQITDNFIAVPEPGAATLALLLAGSLCALRRKS